MSASNEWTEWHLTPRGWERGTEKTDFNRTDRDPPHDTVMTITASEFISSGFSPMRKSTEITWKSDDKAEIAKLTEQFGALPHHL